MKLFDFKTGRPVSEKEFKELGIEEDEEMEGWVLMRHKDFYKIIPLKEAEDIGFRFQFV